MLLPRVAPGVVIGLAALALAAVAGLAWRRFDGRMRGSGRVRPGLAADLAGEPRLTSGQLGRDLGERATLVQFSSAFCAPCRATRRILADVAEMTDGIAHIEIDAESRLDLVRSLNVLRTPTVLVLNADGRVVRRASGQPRKHEVIAALGEAIDYNT